MPEDSPSVSSQEYTSRQGSPSPDLLSHSPDSSVHSPHIVSTQEDEFTRYGRSSLRRPGRPRGNSPGTPSWGPPTSDADEVVARKRKQLLLQGDQHSDEDAIDLDQPLHIPLRPFRNKVGGHASMYKFTRRAVCKVSAICVFLPSSPVTMPLSTYSVLPKWLVAARGRNGRTATKFFGNTL